MTRSGRLGKALRIIRLSILLSLLQAVPVVQAASSFVHITLDTRDEHRVSVCVSQADSKLYRITVSPPFGSLSEQHAWLISTGTYFGPEFQEFRRYLWSDGYLDSLIQTAEKLEYLHEGTYLIEILESEMSGSYVYVDYLSPVKYAGDYFSIDLGTFIGVDDGLC